MTSNITLRYDSVDRAFLQHIAMAPGASDQVTEGVKQRNGMTMTVYASDGARLVEDRWWSGPNERGEKETAEAFVERLLAAAAERTHERRRKVSR